MENLLQLEWHFAWGATVFCLFFVIRFAFVFARHDGDLFRALLAFAASWGVLIVYYSTPTLADPHEIKELPELLPAMNGFLTAYFGAMLLHYKNKAHKGITLIEGVIAFLLLILAFPTAIQFPFDSPETAGLPGIKNLSVVVITLFLKTAGFFALFKALSAFCQVPILRNASTTIIWLYLTMEILFAFKSTLCIVFGCESLPMNSFFLFSFAVIKVMHVLTFLPAIFSGLKPFRSNSFLQNFLHFLHIDIPHKKLKGNSTPIYPGVVER